MSVKLIIIIAVQIIIILTLLFVLTGIIKNTSHEYVMACRFFRPLNSQMKRILSYIFIGRDKYELIKSNNKFDFKEQKVRKE